MASRGCFKFTCLGCLGIFLLLILVGGIAALLAWTGRDDQRIEERTVAAPAPAGAPATAADSLASGALTAPGRLVLRLEAGEFRISPGRPGESIQVESRYDAEVHELTERYEVLPDSSWVYEVSFRRTMPMLQAIFRGMFGGETDEWIHVTIPPDIPLTLELHARDGGMESDLGGLWLRQADLDFARGGFVLDFSSPLREPMESLAIRGSMGGLVVNTLGNASPGALKVDQRMGGADVDLRGPWARDAAIALAIEMGGMSVRLPRDVEVVGAPGRAGGGGLRTENAEVPLPTLRFSVEQSMGEVEFR